MQPLKKKTENLFFKLLCDYDALNIVLYLEVINDRFKIKFEIKEYRFIFNIIIQ